jgi:hypothetical protein
MMDLGKRINILDERKHRHSRDPEEQAPGKGHIHILVSNQTDKSDPRSQKQLNKGLQHGEESRLNKQNK